MDADRDKKKDDEGSDLKAVAVVAGVGLATTIAAWLFGSKPAVAALTKRPVAPVGHAYYLDPTSGETLLRRTISDELFKVEGIDSAGADMNVNKALAFNSTAPRRPSNASSAALF